MRLPLAIPAFLAAMSAPVLAQTATSEPEVSLSSGGSSTIKQLLSSGYEIKASVPNGSKFIV
ncbi:signal peptide protein, partial [Agrobacterium radiobacter DSM 30147]